MAIRGFKGYSLGTALYKNKDAIKALAAVIFGYNYVTGFTLPQFLGSVGVGALVIVGKIVVDFIDYALSEEPVTKTVTVEVPVN